MHLSVKVASSGSTGYAIQVCLCFIQFLSHLCETLIEIGRYRKIPREDRLCLYCENKIDDECHSFFIVY